MGTKKRRCSIGDEETSGMNWTSLVKEIGPYLGIMFCFIWRDYRREEQLVKQVMNLQKFILEELMGLIEKTNDSLDNFRRNDGA